jgi:hypothetical protein
VADIVESADVGMIQGRNSACFPIETLPGLEVLRKMRGKNLDGYDAVKAGVPRTIHLAHAAGSERRLNFVRAKFRARG